METIDNFFVHGHNTSIMLRSDPPFADSDPPFADIAYRLRWHRDLEGMTQHEYAARIGVKRAALNNWESGNYRLSLDGGLALRRTFGLSLDFMFEGIDDALPMTLRRAWRDNPRVSASK